MFLLLLPLHLCSLKSIFGFLLSERTSGVSPVIFMRNKVGPGYHEGGPPVLATLSWDPLASIRWDLLTTIDYESISTMFTHPGMLLFKTLIPFPSKNGSVGPVIYQAVLSYTMY